jgi:hypothetical protein
MNTWRRLLVAATVAVVALGAAVPSSWGQDPTPPDESSPVSIGAADAPSGVVQSWALAPAGSADPGEAGNRPNLSYEVAPGAELDDAVTLFNFSNVPLTFHVYPTDAINNEDGQFDLIPRDQEPEDVGTWITLPQDNVTVAPGSQATMPITVKVPADASPGDHVGAILASNEAEGVGPDGQVVTLDRRTGSRVYVRVTGELDPELAVEDVHTTYKPTLNPLGGSAEVTYRIRNRGNVRLSGAHSVSISGPFGVAKKRIPAADLAEVLPGEAVTLHASFDDVPATALAFTKVRLDPSGVGDDGAELSTVTGGAITLAPPITVVLLALALGLALRARRAYRRHGQQDVPREVRLT